MPFSHHLMRTARLTHYTPAHYAFTYVRGFTRHACGGSFCMRFARTIPHCTTAVAHLQPTTRRGPLPARLTTPLLPTRTGLHSTSERLPRTRATPTPHGPHTHTHATTRSALLLLHTHYTPFHAHLRCRTHLTLLLSPPSLPVATRILFTSAATLPDRRRGVWFRLCARRRLRLTRAYRATIRLTALCCGSLFFWTARGTRIP